MLQRLKENLAHAQNRMKVYADQARTEREFSVGDRVYLKLQPYKQNSLALRKHLKLSSRYYGPYTILQRIGQVAYKLDLPPGSKIHPVFHVSLLKKYVGKAVLTQPNLPQTTDDGVFHLSPSAVLDRREVLRGKDSIAQLLIQWGDETSELFSWEDAKFMANTYPKFNPWGQGLGNAGGIVVDY